jgi:homocysteine S-methyltransferase
MMTRPPDPLAPFIRQQGLLVLDGGLATALEARGHDLDDPLWSAKLLLEAPEAIGDLHRDYLAAGADCVTTATYQASLAGFRARGLHDDEGRNLLRLAVRLATEARAAFWTTDRERTKRLYPLVAASIGPYGAYLADGSEYVGRYDLDDDGLYAFHRPRWQVLAATDADLLACETIPSGREALVLLRLLRETPACRAWLSFSCRDGAHLCDGTPLRDLVRACDAEPGVVAVGINCTAPWHLPSLIAAAHDATDKPILAYPNLGERYDATTKTWGKAPPADNWLEMAATWIQHGAGGVGGCCRIGPDLIAQLRRRLLP